MYCEPGTGNALSRPGEPTEATPGSELKVRIMTERAARREPLFHPLDGLTPAASAPTPAKEAAWWVADPVAEDSEADLVEPDIDALTEAGQDEAEAPTILPLPEYVERANIA